MFLSRFLCYNTNKLNNIGVEHIGKFYVKGFRSQLKEYKGHGYRDPGRAAVVY